MQGFTDTYRIRKGNLRILFIYKFNVVHIVNITDIGFIKDIYQ